MKVKQLKQHIQNLEDDWELGFVVDCDRDGYTVKCFVLTDDSDPSTATELIFDFEADSAE